MWLDEVSGVDDLAEGPIGCVCARLRPAFITADNINDVPSQNHAPTDIDLLTIDMDGQDYYILDALDMHRFRARVIVVEFRSRFSVGERCVTRLDPSYMWNYTTRREVGCSLQLLNDLLSCKGYRYIAQVAGEHGIWIKESELAPTDVSTLLPHIVREGRGYGGRLKSRPDAMHDMVCNVTKPRCSSGFPRSNSFLVGRLLSAKPKSTCSDSRLRFPSCSGCIEGLVPPDCHMQGDANRVRRNIRRGSLRRTISHANVSTACARWPYLSRDELTTRHIITAHWMRSLQPVSILDIGAYSNPISNFLQHCPRDVTVVEPCGELTVTSTSAYNASKQPLRVNPWLSVAMPCPTDSGKKFVLTVSPATAAGFFASKTVHYYDAVVCLGCDALVERGVKRSMLLDDLRRPVDIFLEYPFSYEPSRQQFAASADDSPLSAAVWGAANCSIIKVARLYFPELNASHPGVGLSGPRVLQHVHCGHRPESHA